MNQKQIFILIIGSVLIIFHLILYFSNVQAKYAKLQLERRKLKTGYSQSLSDVLGERQGTFKRVLFAWSAVSIFLVLGTGLSLWICRKGKPPRPL